MLERIKLSPYTAFDAKEENEIEKKPVKKTKEQPIKEQEQEPAVEEKEVATDRKWNWKDNWKRNGAIVVVLFLFIGMAYAYYLFASTASRVINSDEQTPLLEQLGMIIGDTNQPLKGEHEDRINVLLLGIGGENHDGGTLTDSIMVASIKPSTNEVSLLSLPRDLAVKIYDDENPNYWEGRKINVAYSVGGVELARETVSDVTGLDIHYYVLIDFNGFTTVIDEMGGIDVDVEQSFVGLYGAQELSLPCPSAQLYYLEDGAYCSVPFEAGVEHMDGERALIFARIRKLAPGSENADEGNDFARAQRQQRILESARNQALSAQTLLRPDRLQGLLHGIGDHMETNMELWEMVRFGEMAKDIDTSQIISQVVDDSPQGLVYGKIAEETGAFVLVPTAGEYNFSEIHALADNAFETVETIEEAATVQVLNGTTTTGLAARTAERLQNVGITIAGIGNAPSQTTEETIIYDLSRDENASTADALKEELNASVASSQKLEELLESDPNLDTIDPTVDFIVILGVDSNDQ